jgi:hypothetical protein
VFSFVSAGSVVESGFLWQAGRSKQHQSGVIRHDFENQTSLYRSRDSVALRDNFLCARGNPEQRAACAPDAFRLCAGYSLDPTRIEFCLRQNRSDLSDACRSVFEQSAGQVASRSKSLNQGLP